MLARIGKLADVDRGRIRLGHGFKELCMEDLTAQKCEACRVGAPSVTAQEIEQLHPQVPEWRIIQEDGIPKLERTFTFKNFKDAIAFTDAVGAAAEEAGHHPRLTIEWGKVAVAWWTHKIRNLHKNDFIMAARTDAIYKKQAQS
jgi:4a-hydroxytetrahydrobiopterin dehydratase